MEIKYKSTRLSYSAAVARGLINPDDQKDHAETQAYYARLASEAKSSFDDPSKIEPE